MIWKQLQKLANYFQMGIKIGIMHFFYWPNVTLNEPVTYLFHQIKSIFNAWNEIWLCYIHPQIEHVQSTAQTVPGLE